MTQDEIKKRRTILMHEISGHNLAIEKIRLDLKALALNCSHPNRYEKSHYDGSNSINCPDCGWSDG